MTSTAKKTAKPSKSASKFTTLVLQKRKLIPPVFPFAGVDYMLLRPEDITPLGRLLYEAYDDYQPFNGKTLNAAQKEAQETLDAQKSGCVLYEASYTARYRGKLLSAVVVTKKKTGRIPWITYALTLPEERGKGYENFLLEQAANRLFAQGFDKVQIKVAQKDTDALSFFADLGFKKTRP